MGTPKPAYTSIKQTLETIGDLGKSTTSAAPLDVTVGSTTTPATDLPQDTVRRVLLARENGTYVLALWQPKPVFQWTGGLCPAYQDLTVAPVQYQVTLGGPSDAFTVTQYTPTTSAAPVSRRRAHAR